MRKVQKTPQNAVRYYQGEKCCVVTSPGSNNFFGTKDLHVYVRIPETPVADTTADPSTTHTFKWVLEKDLKETPDD